MKAVLSNQYGLLQNKLVLKYLKEIKKKIQRQNTIKSQIKLIILNKYKINGSKISSIPKMQTFTLLLHDERGKLQRIAFQFKASKNN